MLVSTLIPCYNGERWIAHAISSALEQTWPYTEVIVIDDGSTDGSLDAIQSFGNRIRWETGPNRGGNAARNRLLELARGDWLQYLDADDYLLPDKISAQMNCLSACPSADLVYGPVLVEYETETTSERYKLAIQEPHDPWILLARWYLPQTGACIWKKQAIIDVGSWKIDQPCCQEHELYLRMLMGGKRFRYCDQVGAVYRKWSTNTVSTADVPQVHRRRLEIKQRAEDYLRKREQLTPARLHALNLSRFEIARSEWQFDRTFANEIMRRVYDLEPAFVPNDTPAAPRSYRVALRLFGFPGAERLAQGLRRR